jgi:SPP1 family predicted phage head-tail adaptor
MNPYVGALKHRLLFQEQAVADDGYGGEVVQWQDVGSCWGRVVPATARAAYLRGKTNHTEDVVVTMRARQRFALDERSLKRFRFIHRGRTFSIETLAAVAYALDYIELQCTLWGAVEESMADDEPQPGGAFYDGTFNYDGQINYDGAAQ